MMYRGKFHTHTHTHTHTRTHTQVTPHTRLTDLQLQSGDQLQVCYVYVYIRYTHLCVCIEREISCIEGNFTHVHAHARTRTHTRAHTHTHTCRYGKQEMRQGQRPRAVILAGKAPGKTRPSADRFSPQAHLCAQIGRRFERCGCVRGCSNAGPWRMFTGWMDATVPCVN